MEQIKTDVKRQKRVSSGDWDTSHTSTHVEDHSLSASVKAGTGKENHRHRQTSSLKSNVSRSRASPKKSSKSTGEDTDLLKDFSYMSINLPAPIVNITLVPPSAPAITQAMAPLTLAPPSYPSNSIRLTTNEDLNRFVSSSTASGTTLTAGSAPSFVKHAGPAHIRTIAPGDLPSLPERFGDMLFDKVMMKWIKSTTMEHEKSVNNSVEVSDDPFGDIESLRDDSKTGDEIEQSARPLEDDVNQGGLCEMSMIEEQSEVDDGEEMELTSFSTDASAHVVNIMTGLDTDGYDDDLTTDSDDANDLHTATQGEINDIDFDSDYEDVPPQDNSPAVESSDLGSHLLQPPPPPAKSVTTPNRGNFGSLNGTPVIKSALKSNSLTPTSALKNSHRYQTPVHRTGHHRSVSFSDGKRDGPIRGLGSCFSLDIITQSCHPRYWYL
jgi:protein NUD1